MLYSGAMNTKRALIFPLALLCAVSTGCAAQKAAEPVTPEPPAIVEAETLSMDAVGMIQLNNDETTVTGAASFADGVVTVHSPGTYHLSGSLTGQINVEAEGEVELVLAGASITAATPGTSAIDADGDADLTITLAEGTVNALSDGANAPDENGKAVLRAKGPLTIGGAGVLTVTAGADNGIQGKDGVAITGGILTVTAANHTVKSTGPIEITGGTLTLIAGNDGLSAEDGRITAGDITVTGGSVTIVTGGGGGDAINHAGESFGPGASREVESESTVGAKGVKADGNITVTGGQLDVNSADDAVHAAGDVIIDGGDLTLLSSDDAVHADNGLVINGGTVTITDCFEGLEAYTIDVNGGDLFIRSVNDGINANGPEMMFNRNASTDDRGETYFRMTGGTLDLAVTGNMSNMGDGIDSNGAAYIEGGTLLVSAIGTFMENGIDTGGTLRIDGGIVVAGGAATMMEGVTSNSDHCSATVVTGTQPDGTTVTITDEDGNVIHSVVLVNTFNSLVLSHPDMVQGHVYTVTYGTDSTTLDFTNTNVVSVGSRFGMGGPGGGMPGGPGGFRP